MMSFGERRRLLIACGLVMTMANQMASGMPFSQDQNGMQSEVQSTDVLQNYVAMLLTQESRKESHADGYESVHPLNRRELIAEGEAEMKYGKRQTTVTITSAVDAAASTSADSAATSSAVAVTSVAATSAVAAATSSVAAASTYAVASSSAASTSLPAVTPVSSGLGIWTASSSSTSSTATSTPINSKNIFSPHNKLFPAVIAACVAIGCGVLIICIAIGKCVAHSRMTPEEKAGEYGDYFKKGSSKDGGFAIRGARSLRRAFTNKKLGSFARRNQEGTVLIDVGDEVYAVTPEVAREYERERSALGGSSGGSRLTVNVNNASPLRQALKNAEMTVAANGSQPYSQAVSRGLDVASWRAQSALPGIDEGKADNGLSRSISQRLTDGYRAFRGKELNSTKPTFGRPAGAYSFDSEKQDLGEMRLAEVPPTAYLPVITRGGKDWNIRPQEEKNIDSFHHTLKSKGSESSLQSSQLSHERHTLTDAPVPRPVVEKIREAPTSTSASRPKSILIKRDDQQTRKDGPIDRRISRRDGSYRQRKPVPTYEQQGVQRTKTSASHHRSRQHPSSTSTASPKMFQKRSSTGQDVSPIFIKPSKPNASQEKDKDANAPQTRELFRPLPMPPAISPLT